MECSFCKKILSSQWALKSHQAKTKYCLALQGKTDVKGSFTCAGCGKNFLLNNVFKRHTEICKKGESYVIELEKKYKILEEENKKILSSMEEIKNVNTKLLAENASVITNNTELKLKLGEYEAKMFNLASKPTIVNKNKNSNNRSTTTNTVQNLGILDLKPETILQKVETEFTLQHLENGIKGVAKFTNDYIIKDGKGEKMVLCSDPSRMIFKYKDAEGVVQKDIRAIKLKNAVKDPIIKKSQEMFMSESTKLFDIISKAPDKEENTTNNEEQDIIDVTSARMDTLRENFLQVKRIDDNSEIYAKELVLLTN